MKGRCLLFAIALAGCLLVPTAAQADPPPCGLVCGCEASCSTACLRFILIGGEPQQVEVTCGWNGNCAGGSMCPGDGCDVSGCTHFVHLDNGNNTHNGTSNNECIYAYAGNDTVDGKAGDDQIFLGDGTDTGYGDSGRDCLFGDGGNDHLDGGSGTDEAHGGAGADTCVNAETKTSC